MRIVLATVSLSEVFEKMEITGERDKKTNVGGYDVKLIGSRLTAFKIDPKCCKCGLQGDYFSIEKNCEEDNPHINMYGIGGEGNEVLMSRIHVHSTRARKLLGIYEEDDVLGTICSKCLITYTPIDFTSIGE